MVEYMEAMAELYEATTREGRYQNAVRNLSLAQIALVEKEMLTPEEEREVTASGVLSYAREKFLELSPVSRAS